MTMPSPPPATMASNAKMIEFFDRYQQIQAQKETSDELIRDIIVYSQHLQSTLGAENEQLKAQVQDLQLDLTHNVKSRREMQQQLQGAETDLETIVQNYELLKEQNEQNPYLIVLIDGDGLLFREDLVRQGVEGGRKAANALRAALLGHCGTHVNGIEVMAQVFVNLGDLARVMKKDGSIEKEIDLKNFTLGFSRNSHFEFVDLGPGKDQADEKLRETAKWHLRNQNCKQVILGCSHDSGYAPFLHNLLRNDQAKQRITILEGFPTHRLLVETNVRIINFDHLFRSDKLVEKATSNGIHQRLQPLPAPTDSPPVVSAATAPPPSSGAAPAAPLYARVIKSASPPPQMTLPLQPKPKASVQVAPVNKTPAHKTPAWNPGPRGLDAPLNVSESALSSIKKRKDNNKLCNNHYLWGPCAKGDSCCFEHKYKPSADEITAIAFLARLNPCINGQDCEVEGCIYGHHCPSVQNGRCNHPYCKFDLEAHPPGTILRKREKEYDNY